MLSDNGGRERLATGAVSARTAGPVLPVVAPASPRCAAPPLTPPRSAASSTTTPENATSAAWKTKPIWDIVTTRDRNTHATVQRLITERAYPHVTEAAVSHSVATPLPTSSPM
ncbi:hypothetical protein [Streptomyces sp. NPDC092370]|uniref:hypothetical protein n=1 Tax=Streptomyces sp. NPDC092370 TaxID=3366016 RepID=UPI0037F7E8A8